MLLHDLFDHAGHGPHPGMDFKALRNRQRQYLSHEIGLYWQPLTGEVGISSVIDFRENGLHSRLPHDGEHALPIVSRSIGVDGDPYPVLETVSLRSFRQEVERPRNGQGRETYTHAFQKSSSVYHLISVSR